MTRRALARAATIAALPLAVVVLVLVLLRSGSTYVIHARFVDASQLVTGDLVEVAGRKVGSITKIALTNDNQADLTLHIDDGSLRPLHRGTIATVRAVGLSGIANRFVELTPGPGSGVPISDGGVLASTETRPIVDLDALLDSLDNRTRGNLQSLIREGAALGNGTVRQTNAAFAALNPALSETAALSAELVRDRAGLDRLVASTADISTTLSTRQSDLEQGLGHAASVFRALAGERAALGDAVTRAPAVLAHGTATLAGVRTALIRVQPALRAAGPVAAPLAQTLRALVPTARDAVPALAQLRGILPEARGALAVLPGLVPKALPALASTTAALQAAQPLLIGFRPYAPELVTGLFNGFGGSTGGSYDANGHFLRIQVNTGQLAAVGGGAFGSIGLPGAGYRAGSVARCPGGAAAPAPDKSNPYVPDPSLCDPSQDATP